MEKKKIKVLISFVVGVLLFIGVIIYLGPESFLHIYENIDLTYLPPFAFFTTLVFATYVWRFQYVMHAYKKKSSFWVQFKQTISSFAVSYVTPSVRIGGEPLRVYMLKKENNIDIKTGTSIVIIDKFIEFTGSLLFGIIGMILIMFIPGVPLYGKSLLFLALLAGFFVLFFVYYFTIRDGSGPFTYMLELLRFYRFPKWRKLKSPVVMVEKKMEKFFREHKKEFIIGMIFYVLSGLAMYYETKFMLLLLGMSVGFTDIVLIIVVWGAINFIPVPAALGFQEVGQSGLFAIIFGAGEVGLAFSLISRIRSLIFVALGFSFISGFTGEQVMRKLDEKAKKKKIE